MLFEAAIAATSAFRQADEGAPGHNREQTPLARRCQSTKAGIGRGFANHCQDQRPNIGRRRALAGWPDLWSRLTGRALIFTVA